MSLNETLTLIAIWCGGYNANAPSDVKNSCKARLMECLKLEDIGISRANVIGCFKNTRMV
jgi:hypothetical protein